MTIFTESEYEIELSAVQGPAGGFPTIANNTLLGNTSGVTAVAIAVSASSARTLLSINNVDNTSDANKPISTATQTALDGKANNSHNQPFSSITDRPTTLAGYGITDAASNAHPWAGVKYTLLGTSISAQTDSFVSVLNTLLGSTAQNLGQSGQTIVPLDSGAIYTSIGNVSLNSHLVIVDGLVNDYRFNTPIGTLADTTQATLHGTLYQLVTRLMEQNPLRQIVFCTQFGYTLSGANWITPASTGSLTVWNNAIKDAGTRLGIPVCDIATLSGIGGPTASVFMPDGIHINNPTGAARYANTLFEFLRNVPRGASPTEVPTGWTLTDATISDISGFRATPTAITGGLLTYTKSSDYSVLWFGGTGRNAMQFDCATNPNNHIAVCSGPDGAGAFGAYSGPSIAFRIDATGNITISSLVQSTGPVSNSATRFRCGILNRSVRLEAWNGSSWILESVFSLPLQSSLVAGVSSTARLGVVVVANDVPFRDIRVGTYTT